MQALSISLMYYTKANRGFFPLICKTMQLPKDIRIIILKPIIVFAESLGSETTFNDLAVAPS